MSCSGRTHPASHGVFQEPISLVIAEIEATREMECMQRAKIETSGAQELYIHQQPQRLWHLGCFVQLRGVKDAAPNSRALEAKLANLVWPVVLVSNASRSFIRQAVSKMAVMDERVLRTTPAYQARDIPSHSGIPTSRAALFRKTALPQRLSINPFYSVFFPLSGGFSELGGRAAGTHSEKVGKSINSCDLSGTKF